MQSLIKSACSLRKIIETYDSWMDGSANRWVEFCGQSGTVILIYWLSRGCKCDWLDNQRLQSWFTGQSDVKPRFIGQSEAVLLTVISDLKPVTSHINMWRYTLTALLLVPFRLFLDPDPGPALPPHQIHPLGSQQSCQQAKTSSSMVVAERDFQWRSFPEVFSLQQMGGTPVWKSALIISAVKF